MLSVLASKEYGWGRRNLRTIYMATVHSVLHYCGAAWQPWLARSNMQILERAQHRASRVMTGQLSDTPLECLRLEAGITSFATKVRKNCLTSWEKSARLPPQTRDEFCSIHRGHTGGKTETDSVSWVRMKR